MEFKNHMNNTRATAGGRGRLIEVAVEWRYQKHQITDK